MRGSEGVRRCVVFALMIERAWLHVWVLSVNFAKNSRYHFGPNFSGIMTFQRSVPFFVTSRFVHLEVQTLMQAALSPS
jgi:hypothetical protein